MRKSFKIAAAVASFLIAFSGAGCSSPNFTKIELKDNGALLTNPNMGWNFAYYSNTFTEFNQYLGEGDYLDNYPCDILFMRVGWRYWQPEEEKYDWERFEEILRPWWEKGKRVVLGWVVTHPGDQNTPLWVKDAGASGNTYYWDKKVLEVDDAGYTVKTEKGETVYDEELYDEESERYAPEYYLSYSEYDTNKNGRLDEGEKDPNGDGWLDATWQSQQNFYGSTTESVDWALNEACDPDWNNGNPVDSEDYKNFRPTWVVDYNDPVFLEKFNGFLAAAAARYDNDPRVEVVDICSLGDWGEGHSAYTRLNKFSRAAIQKHINMFATQFKNTQIVANDDLEQYYGAGFSEYCVERGVGVVDCSVACTFSSPNDLVGNVGNTAVTDLFWREEAVMLENHFANPPTEALLDSVNQCHASYARIHYDPAAYLATEWADKITLRLGYRLTFTGVEVSELKMGTTATIKYTLKNTGAAPCYQGGNPTFYILDSTGRVCCKATDDFDVKDLKVAQSVEKTPEYTGELTMKLPDKFYEDQTGRYYLAVAVTYDGEACYNLPLDNQDENGRKMYKIAKFTIGEVY